MATTLQTLIDQTADYIKVDLDDDDGTTVQARIVSSLNEAKNMIARKYYPMYYTEDITLDADASFNVIDDPTKTFYKLVSVEYNDALVMTEQYASTVYCETSASVDVSVTYQYIPEDMAAVTDAYSFPDVVDYRILCYRAAKEFYEIKGTSSSRQKAELWDKKWKEAVRTRFETDSPTFVKNVYNFESSVW